MSSYPAHAWRAGTVLTVATAMVAAFLVPAAGATPAADTPRDASAERQALQDGSSAAACYSDAGDDAVNADTDEVVGDPRADIVEHCLSYEDRVLVSVQVAEPTNPETDPNWQQATFAGWFLDVDGDDEGDFYVDYSLNESGELGARVLDVREQDPDESPPVVCGDVAAIFDGTSYSAGPFPAECLESPDSVESSVAVSYDLGPDGPRYEDRAPDEGAFPGSVAPSDGVCTDVLPARFADRTDVADVHRPAVDCLFARGITLGVERDGRRVFVPRAQITRAQFSAFVARTLIDAGVALPEPQRPRFDDVPDSHTFDEVVHRLAAAGILAGVTEDQFQPGEPIRRDQTASVLARAFVFATELESAQPDNPGAYFEDVEGNVHGDNIAFAFEQGLVQGIEAPTQGERGVYAPSVKTPRQQMATVLFRFLTHVEG